MLVSQVGCVGISQGAILDQKAPGGNAGTIMVPLYEVQVAQQNGTAAATWAVSFTLFINDNSLGSQKYQVASVSARFGVASTIGTLQVEIAGAGVAVGSGVNQLTAPVSLSGTANTAVNGTLIGSPNVIVPGAAVNLIFAGTVTNLANCTIVVALQRIS